MRETKAERNFRMVEALKQRGFSFDETQALFKIERTLQRWSELECGDGNNYGSWAIERDEETEKPFMVHHHYSHGNGKDYSTRTAISDRERGALKRLAKIMESHPDFVAYHQGDPRGCALYIVRKSDLNGLNIDANYTRGIAVFKE